MQVKLAPSFVAMVQSADFRERDHIALGDGARPSVNGSRRIGLLRVSAEAAHHWLMTRVPDGLEVPILASTSPASSIRTVP